MEAVPAPSLAAPPASLVVTDPDGHRTRVSIHSLPFQIGRQPESHLILRDSRVSRIHARILAENGGYVVEDCASRHGTFVNGRRITRHTLQNSDRIEFGIQDSYQLVFALDGVELKRLLDQVGVAEKVAPDGVGGNLAKLRAFLDLARALQNSFSIDEVLVSVVDTALAITGAERGFLLLRDGGKLQIRAARNSSGQHLRESDLRVPCQVIHRALQSRRELLSMNFDPFHADEAGVWNTLANLEIRSVICVPLVRLRATQTGVTQALSPANETAGVLYMDSRVSTADLGGGNREFLQALAIEASTVLENARLLEEEETKRQMEEELRLARTIQQSLLPGNLPSAGWLRASGSSVASHQVGGDYFDVVRVTEKCWALMVADVSGKGVSSALLASLLQGALITATEQPQAMSQRVERLNRFLIDRTAGEKYATLFYALAHADGRLVYINAAHPPPLVVRAGGSLFDLEANATPVGLVENAEFPICEQFLEPGDKVVVYSDGVTEAQDADGNFFGRKRLQEVVAAHAGENCAAIHSAIQEAVAAFAEGAEQSDDITVLVVEFQGTRGD